MSSFQHFLLTNFNVRLPKFSQDGNGLSVLTEEWLEHRLMLFERFCLPSVLGQTNLGFTWLVRYDDTMPGARGGWTATPASPTCASSRPTESSAKSYQPCCRRRRSMS